jgi:uncharacterized protein (DUF58 family)
MIPREILKKIRQIELRTNRLVSETLAGQYHSVFKGQGMNFEEVREYQPGDEVRSIDWNVTARMNHPFVKKFVEERELTLMLVVDVSGSGLFGSREQSKRELAAEIASVLAFSAIRNNDKVGLILFTDTVEKFIPPRKGRKHVLRVIREVLFFEPLRRGTDLNQALEFLLRVTPHKAIAVVISDFIGSPATRRSRGRQLRPQLMLLESLAQASFTMLRQVNRRHDVVAVQIADPYELELPALGRLVLEDAETGEIVEVSTGDARKRAAFAERQARAQADLMRLFRSAGIDAMQLRTDQPYTVTLGKFFETRRGTSNIEHRTSNAERDNARAFHSMFSVRCSMFDVPIPEADSCSRTPQHKIPPRLPPSCATSNRRSQSRTPGSTCCGRRCCCASRRWCLRCGNGGGRDARRFQPFRRFPLMFARSKSSRKRWR